MSAAYTPSGPAPNAPKPQPRPEVPWWKFWATRVVGIDQEDSNQP